MFNKDGSIKRSVWRNAFVIGMGIASLGGAARFWEIALFGVAVMLYSGWYFVQGDEQ